MVCAGSLLTAYSGTCRCLWKCTPSYRLILLNKADLIGFLGGARPHTCDIIASHLRDNNRGVILLGELDKMTAQMDWTRHVQLEVYSLLDGMPRGYAEATPELRRKFRERFFVVGAGTFQGIFAEANHSIGFAPSSAEVEEEIARKAEIPPELLNRFNGRLLMLLPPARKEMSRWIAEIHAELDLDPPDDVEGLAAQAVASGQNTRWLENYVSRLLIGEKPTQ